MSSQLAPPVLETERLRLRGHRQEDFASCCALWADPIVTRYIGGLPFSSENVWSKILRYVGHWTLLGFGYWVLEEKSSGRFVGEAGFADFRREITPSLHGTLEAGWILAPWAHGKGYATEAVNGMLEWATAHFAEQPVVCIIDPENAASLRVAAKCGFREYDRASYKDSRPVVLRR